MKIVVIGSVLVVAFAIYSHYSHVRQFKNLPKIADGYVDPRFKLVQEVFRQNIDNELELGGTFAAYYKGELVVDLWGGYASTESPWRNDTLSTIFSASKGVAAILLAKLVEKGYIDYKQKVSYYWPEFAQNGKESITVEMLVSHKAGIIGFDEPLEFSLMSTDYNQFLSILAAQKPQWTPGSKVGYHMITYGLYLDVLIAKADPHKRPIEQIFREELSVPYGIDFFQGMPYEEQYRAEARIYIKSLWDIFPYLFTKKFFSLTQSMWFDKHEYLKKCVRTFKIGPSFYSLSDRHIKRLPCSSFNGYATARALAKLYGNIVNVGHNKEGDILSKTSADTIDEILSSEHDAILNFPVNFGRGVCIHENKKGQKTFCHYGFGGQGACGDKQYRLGFAYISNHLNPLIFGADERFDTLVDAVYRSIDLIENQS
ncbi:beta-lactamase domain-containing protein 2-like [Argonauta hians]